VVALQLQGLEGISNPGHPVFSDSLSQQIANRQIAKSPNHPITQSPNRRITKSPNHQIAESPSRRITKSTPNLQLSKSLDSRIY
jgi:hypothetical protein